MATHPARRYGTEAALIAVVFLTGFVALLQSWNRWFDPIVDTGRDLYIAEQLANGARLYRDIRYQYPPLAAYVLAGVVRVAGASLPLFAAIGISISAATAVLLFAVARKLAGSAAGFVAAFAFVSLSFAGATTFGSNYVIPYSYAATVGMFFLLLFFACCAVAPKNVTAAAHLRLLRTAGIAAALAASWCKIEYAAAVVVTLAALAAARKTRIVDVLLFGVLGALTLVAACVFFGGTTWLTDGVFAASLTRGEAARRFFATVAGFSAWQERIVDALAGSGASLVITGLLRDRRLRWLAIIAAAAVGVLMPVNTFFRGWGLLQWVSVLWAIGRDRFDVLLPLSALSIGSTLRIPLNVAPWWYGFVLVVPLYLLVTYVVFEYLPARGVYERGAALVWVIVFTGFALRGLADQRLRYSVKEFPVQTIRGTYFDANPDRAAVLSEFLPRAHGDTLVVFPEGIGVDYLAGARTTLTWYTFIPPETADLLVEDRILDELRRSPPHRVAFVKRSVAEFGYRGFGVDYDQRLAAWIRTHYSVEQEWLRPRFQMVVFRLR